MRARQPYVLFFDSDMLLPDATVPGSLLAQLQQGGYSGLQARIVADGIQNVWERAQDLHWRATAERPGYRAAIGCGGTLFRRDVLLANPPDPFFTGAAEDGDLSRRITHSGGRLGVATVPIVHAHRSTFRSLVAQRIWYGRGSARRAWRERSLVHLAGPLATAGALVIRAVRRRQPELLPYAVVHGLAGMLGVTVELASLGFSRLHPARLDATSAPGTG
jgi:hypothetical protein